VAATSAVRGRKPQSPENRLNGLRGTDSQPPTGDTRHRTFDSVRMPGGLRSCDPSICPLAGRTRSAGTRRACRKASKRYAPFGAQGRRTGFEKERPWPLTSPFSTVWAPWWPTHLSIPRPELLSWEWANVATVEEYKAVHGGDGLPRFKGTVPELGDGGATLSSRTPEGSSAAGALGRWRAGH
jgi:hypothetical protein